MLIESLLSFIAGVLTVLAPCILPLLPIILAGSVLGGVVDKKRPIVIIGSLLVSIFIFTLLLKVSTVFIGIDQQYWQFISGGIIFVVGLFMLFPNAWARIIGTLGFEHRSQQLLGNANSQKNSWLSAILIGFALGPVFSSCSPTYAWVIAVVIPENYIVGLWYLLMYLLGLAFILTCVALLGSKFIQRIKWASDPKGIFQRTVAIIFIIVGLFIATGVDKKIQTWLVEKDYFNLIQLEQKIVPDDI